MKYDIICYNSIDDLIKYVNAELKKGWKCVGGVAVLHDINGYTVFYQSIVKESN